MPNFEGSRFRTPVPAWLLQPEATTCCGVPGPNFDKDCVDKDDHERNRYSGTSSLPLKIA